jgi:hypothetical protein
MFAMSLGFDEVPETGAEVWRVHDNVVWLARLVGPMTSKRHCWPSSAPHEMQNLLVSGVGMEVGHERALIR